MSYRVKSVFLTVQGEGYHAGRAAVFARFAGCNLWSGLPEHRGKQGSCSAWCDTDFRGGTAYSLGGLQDAIAGLWPSGSGRRFVVLTGGEPSLQVDAPLVESLHSLGFEVAIETNGTQRLPASIDWVTVSPKSGHPLALRSADELKVVFPQAGSDPAQLAAFKASHRFLQPMDGPLLAENTAATVAYCLSHPEWRVSVQAHKVIGMA